MVASLFFVLAAGFLAATGATAAAVGPCDSKCRFTFCKNSDAILDIDGTKSDKPITGPICAGRGGPKRIGIVNTGGEVLVSSGRSPLPISKFYNGLDQPFAKTPFKSYPIMTKNGTFKSGIGHQAFLKGEERALHGLCVYTPITSYQVLNAKGHVVSNVNLSGQSQRRDCLVMYIS